MAIGPDQRAYIMGTLKAAIAEHYGDEVPDLKEFTNRKRKTFIEKLESEVGATEWRLKLQDARQVLGNAKGVVTRLSENRNAKRAQLSAAHAEELAKLKAKQEKEMSEVTSSYEVPMAEANQKQRELEDSLKSLERQSYFAGLKAEDDGRHVHSPSVDTAISQRVDGFIEKNLMADDEGKRVQLRIRQEKLISDAVYIAKDINHLRELVLGFVGNGKLPEITVEAWLIEKGKDIMNQGE